MKRSIIKPLAVTFIRVLCASRSKKTLGGTLRLFSSIQSSRTFSQQDREAKLYISAKLTEGDDAVVLNQKMWQLDRFLAKFKEVKRFVTRVDGKSGSIEVEFTDEHKDGAFPQYLESQVIRETLLIGGVDWSTTGVSERGFSNFINHIVNGAGLGTFPGRWAGSGSVLVFIRNWHNGWFAVFDHSLGVLYADIDVAWEVQRKTVKRERDESKVDGFHKKKIIMSERE